MVRRGPDYRDVLTVARSELMGIVDTKNGFGWTTTVPNQITLAFLEFIASQDVPSPVVLDIGCAFGVATLPALAAGATVVAMDLDPGHLKVVREQAAAQGFGGRLETVVGRYPDDLKVENLYAIHSSNVLHFLRGAEIERGAVRMFESLRPGGKTFIQVGTIFAGHIKSLVPVFDENERRGRKWPGEVDNAREYVLPEFRSLIPDQMNFLSGPPLVDVYERAGFRIDKAWYYTRNGLEPPLTNDGREHFGLIACKSLIEPVSFPAL
jgi:SAM-dependent methyltransferase